MLPRLPVLINGKRPNPELPHTASFLCSNSPLISINHLVPILPQIYLLLISVANEAHLLLSQHFPYTQPLIYSSFGHRLRMISLQSNNKQRAFFAIITVLIITKMAGATLIKPNYLFTNSWANSKSNYSIIK